MDFAEFMNLASYSSVSAKIVVLENAVEKPAKEAVVLVLAPRPMKAVNQCGYCNFVPEKVTKPEKTLSAYKASQWQAFVAYVNVDCYYVVIVPLGCLLGFKFNFGLKGIWSRMMGGTAMHTFILLWLTFRIDWDEEVDERTHYVFYSRNLNFLKEICRSMNHVKWLMK